MAAVHVYIRRGPGGAPVRHGATDALRARRVVRWTHDDVGLEAVCPGDQDVLVGREGQGLVRGQDQVLRTGGNQPGLLDRFLAGGGLVRV